MSGKVDGGQGEELDHHLQYSYTLAPGTWTEQMYEDEQEQPSDGSQKP